MLYDLLHLTLLLNYNSYNADGHEVKSKIEVMFDTQKSGNKTSLGEIGLNIRTNASPKVGQDQD